MAPAQSAGGAPPDGHSRKPHTIWWRGEDSNLRRLSRQIYSLIPLAAREPLRERKLRILRKVPGPVNQTDGLSRFPTADISPLPDRAELARMSDPGEADSVRVHLLR